MAPRPESGSEGLQASLAAIFDQAQTSLANHRKNCVALYKIHVKASVGDKKSRKETPDQADFIAAFLDMVSRVVGVKKGPATVDRIIKFVAQYVRFVNEKALEDKAKRQPEIPTNSISSGSADGDEDTLASVFISSILEWVIQGFVAKNKVVRYQTVHLVAEMISFLGEIDEDSYLALRESLIERSTCDKEPTIRAQAVSALARLIGSEDPSELQDGEKSILDVLLDVLTLDPAADVRRAALVHIPLNAGTLPSLLPRARDVDPLTRKLLYTSVLIPRLAHPRHLSIAQRETLVQTGLGDREPAVRLAAGKMVAAWFNVVQGEQAEADLQAGAVAWTGDDGGIMRALVAFLTLFDVVGPGEAVAVDALLALLTTHANLFDGFVFEDAYWHNLSPESAVLARAFLEHCLGGANPNSSYSGGRGEERLEAASLPVVTAFAFHVQEAYNTLLMALEDVEVVRTLALSAGPRGLDNEDEDDEAEEELAKREVVLGELLRMAVKLDYGDEIGRRKVYTVTRDMLAHPQLPPGLIERCLDVLKEIMPTERELIRVVVEVVMDLREPAGEEEELDHDTTMRSDSTTRKERSLRRAKARDEMTAEEGARADLTDLRCLTVTIGMLERVHGNFEDNSTLEGILADLIIPAVRRKELGIREKGLVALGLCCVIAKSIAVKSLQLFLSQIQNAPEQLKFKLLQIVFDLMIMYDQQLWGRVEDGQAILTFLADTLEAEESPMVQAVLCVGLAKLLLAGLADDPKLLKTLLLAYVSPHTAGNAELRQCLSYFFSVYCYSSAQNQSRVQSIFIPAFEEVARMHDEEAGEGQTMVTPHQFGLLVIDWTDARKAAESTTPTPSRHVHADLAVDILLALYDSDKRSSDQEVLCTLLNHLHIEGTLTSPVLVKLSVLLQHIQTQCPFDDPTLDKAVSRFKNRFTAEFEAELAEVDWAEWGTPEMSELYDFIGIDVPEADAREAAGSPRPESPVPAKARKEKPKPAAKRSRSKPARQASEESGQGSDESESEEVAPPDGPVPKRAAKRSQLKAATPDAEENDSAEEDVAMVPSPPPKSKAKKAPARKSSSKPVPEPEETEMRSENEEAPEDAETKPSPPPKPKAKVPARRSRSKAAPKREPEEMEEDGVADGDEARPSSAPPKTKAKAPARRSRSKAAPEEEEEAPSSVPVAKASKAKASTRRSRSKAAAEENEEGEAPSSVPVAQASKQKAPARRSRSKAAPEESELPDEDEAPSSVPAPRASRAKAPARKSRSKAAAEDEEVPEDEAPSSVPVTKPSKVKAPARRSRSKAAPAQENEPGSEDGNVAGPSTVPSRRASRQTRASAAPPPPEDAEPALESDDENAAPPAGPVTPPKTQSGRKRVRTPSAKLALPSPADKKRRKPAVPPIAPAAPVPMRGTRSSSRRKPPPDIPIASDDDFGGYSES